jgi:16S rRNA (cytidine1402-2'-O)-methyltransferase
MSGKLYVVPTPIGNIKDITIRAKEVLEEVDIVLAEDTRTSGRLMQLLGLEVKLRAFHMHNEHRALSGIVQELERGTQMALISDAGTPAISDPGFLLTRACVEHGIAVECLPGPTAFIPALVCSGLPCDRFIFEGFLPQKKGRRKRLESLKQEERTIVFYESPHRVAKLFSELAEIFGPDRRASYSRELTKLYEETRRGTISELVQQLEQATVKGEFVVCVSGST